MRNAAVIAGLCVASSLAPRLSFAQYTADFQTNIISGIVSNWTGDYSVGSDTFANVLLIKSTGVLVNTYGYVGQLSTSSNNTVLVAGIGSLWSNLMILTVGGDGIGNSLTISNGGQVFSTSASVGNHGRSNSVLVTDAGSTWIGNSFLGVGNTGMDNKLAISNGARVADEFATIGLNPSASGNVVLVSGGGSVWSNTATLYVGHQGPGNRLVISAGGQVFNLDAYLSYEGYYSQSSSNRVLVTDGGSIWSNRGTLYVGGHGTGSSLVISNGGSVLDNTAYVGGSSSSSSDNNRVLVIGTGSVWNTDGDLYVGRWGSGNSLAIVDGGQIVAARSHLGAGHTTTGNNASVTGEASVWRNTVGLTVGENGGGTSLIVSNGGKVINGFCSIASTSNSSNNTVRVVGGGIWEDGELRVGDEGTSNALIVAGGSVLATNLTIGFASTLCNNLVQLDGGAVIVTNAAGDATLEVRRGAFILSSGTFRVDRLVITNSCAQFVRNGGTLIVGSLVLDANMDADNDGIANGYEQSHGLDPFNPADASADNDGDGASNLQEYLAGTNPDNSASSFRIFGVVETNDDVLITWTTAGGRTNVLESATSPYGAYTNISPHMVLPGNGDTTTNYVDIGAVTNSPARFYRVRLVP